MTNGRFGRTDYRSSGSKPAMDLDPGSTWRKEAMLRNAAALKQAQKTGKATDTSSPGGSTSSQIMAGAQGAQMLGILPTEGTGGGAASGALSGAAIGSAFGPWGAGIGAGVGALAGIAQARAARKQKLGQIEAQRQMALSQVEASKGAQIQTAISGMRQAFSNALRTPQGAIRLGGR